MRIRLFIYVGGCLFLTACGSNNGYHTPKSAPAAFGIAASGCTEEVLCPSPQMNGSDSKLE